MGKLVAYSGFSTSNYLEQPYNSDLDFGTGDFCIMGWVKTTATTGGIVSRNAGSSGTRSFAFGLFSGGNIGIVSNGALTVSTTGLVNSNTWRFVCFSRTSNVSSLYIDGVLDSFGSDNGDVTEAGAVLQIGRDDGGSFAPLDGSLALLRISATAPTAEQIAKIYEDEKVLFQDNAQATLYGSSDAVTALAHDDATNLLHVGTSAGRSVFQGLRRVSNTTTAVGTAISASNGLVVEE